MVISGATAVGKTALAVRLAQHFDTEILSADSRQVYQRMNIGTAKPSAAELEVVTHHFVSSQPLEQTFTAGDFEQQGLKLLKKIFQYRDIVILVGGTGLYIQSLCEGLDEYPEIDPAHRKSITELLENEGIESLQKELCTADPLQYSKMDIQNPQRLVRALEVCRATGQPFSSFQKKEKKVRFFQPIYVQLEISRPDLYARINRRVEQMMGDGLLEEAKQLLPFRHLNALQTVGYQELFDYFDQKTTLSEAVAMVQQNSRRYAKRQLTWLRKHSHWQLFSPTQFDEIVRMVEKEKGFF